MINMSAVDFATLGFGEELFDIFGLARKLADGDPALIESLEMGLDPLQAPFVVPGHDRLIFLVPGGHTIERLRSR